MTTLTTLAAFDFASMSSPYGAVTMDAAGDLFGTALTGGPAGDGLIYEMVHSNGTYAASPVIIASFNGSDGSAPRGGLITDSAGDLFGTTYSGGPSDNGTVFEITNSGGTYATLPISLASFSGSDGANPQGNLIADAAGNLFGTTYSGGASGDGTVFEIARTATGYAATPLVLTSFSGTDGQNPAAGLMIDNNGNLYGTTSGGGSAGVGTVFEITNTNGTYAAAAATLADFGEGTSGSDYAADPAGSLIADSAGDLFGTTQQGGTVAAGTVFEIVNAGGTYSSTPVILASFSNTGGEAPAANLIADAAGNLYGTTAWGGANNDGTVFEIANTATGYASDPTVLASLDGTNGWVPVAGLTADAAGDLFTTSVLGGANQSGTVFELSGTGYQPLAISDTTTNHALAPASQAYSGPVAGLSNEYITAISDGINVTAATPGWFIHTGSGTDAIDVSRGGGTNVLDGSTGSNFLTGGTGDDTFFVDDRSATSPIWSTVVGFHSGDNATVWGVTPADFNVIQLDGQGAAGYTGLTFGFSAAGQPDANLTLAGFSSANILSGALTVSYGATADQPGLPGSVYMLIHAT